MSEKYTVQNEQPVPCIDVLIFNDQGQILLLERNMKPHKGQWSIVGGRVEVSDNNIEHTALREVKEETGLDVELKYLVGVLAQPNRVPTADPRFYIVQTIFIAKVIGGVFRENEEAKKIRWVDFEDARKETLAFNHNDILEYFVERKNKLIPIVRTKFTEFFGTEYLYNETNSRVRFATNAIILDKDRKILLAQRNQKPYIGDWDFPGGHMYVNESLEECIKREVREELGVDCEPGELFHVYSDKGKSPRAADVVSFYFAKIFDTRFEKNIEMKDFRFFAFDELPPNLAYHNDGPLKDIHKFLFG